MDIGIVFVAAAYLFGSVSSAIIVCKAMGLPDPRSGGSGNPGATNVLRLGGKKAAAITLAGDMLKGLIPMLAAVLTGLDTPYLAGVGLAAFLGHLYPLFFGFQGGKGVATALGVWLGLHWLVGLGAVLTWLAVALLCRISSLSALIAAALAPLYIQLVFESAALTAANAAMSALLWWRHRGNIARILKGEEKRIGR